MKRSELKKVLKPLIKECIRDVLFEEGVLSNVISEVVRGMGSNVSLVESKSSYHPPREIQSNRENIEFAKKQLLESIGQNSYNGVNIFEGTEPLRAQSGEQGRALSNVAPSDPGVDLSSIPGADKWRLLVK